MRERWTIAASASRSPNSVGSTIISLWLADGTNYAGQDNLRARHERLVASLGELYGALPDGMRLLIEYKFFEPAFYSTDLPDWGTAALLCRQLGPQAQVLVDTGHHPLGTNVEQIVAVLLGQGLLGGFHFNNRKYADDDLIVGSVDPFELFRIMCEIAWTPDADRIAFMIDQSHNIEGKIDAMIQSVMNIQTAYAKALLVDTDRLAAAQREGDVLGAHRVLLDAFETDVRPVLARLRRASACRRIPSSPSARAATQTRSLASAALLRCRAPMSPEPEPRRVAFVLRVRPDRIDEYVAAHRNVWPEMLEALRDAGISNYSIFRDGNQVFGYFETDDIDAPSSTWPPRRSRAAGRRRWRTCSRSAFPTRGRRLSRRSSGSEARGEAAASPDRRLRRGPGAAAGPARRRR